MSFCPAWLSGLLGLRFEAKGLRVYGLRFRNGVVAPSPPLQSENRVFW